MVIYFSPYYIIYFICKLRKSTFIDQDIIQISVLYAF